MPEGPPTVTETYAPMFVGTFLGTILYGVMLIQAYIYTGSCKRDAWWIKALIAYLVIADTANTIFNFGLIYEPLVLKHGDADVVAISPLFLRADGIVTALISTPVQIFMAWRIKVIMETWIPFSIVTVLSFVSLGAATALAILVSLHPQFVMFDSFRAAPVTWLVTSAAADILIAVCLVRGLSRKKSHISLLNEHLDRLMRLAIQTGAITAIVALLDAIVFLIRPHNTYNFAWDLFLSKLYTNSLLSSLNARNDWRSRRDESPPEMEPNALFNSGDVTTRSSHMLTFNEIPMRNVFVSRGSMHPPPKSEFPDTDLETQWPNPIRYAPRVEPAPSYYGPST